MMSTLLLFLALVLTPTPPMGALCTVSSPGFHDTAQGFPRCSRKVSEATKKAVLKAYQISWADRDRYEVDHYIPLCMGGSNDRANLWPEPWTHAKRKDVLENRLCRQIRNGTITQADAVSQMKAFR
jgi:hypothetical protein